MANHIRSPDMGCHYLHRLHDGHLHIEEKLCSIDTARTSTGWDCGLVVVHVQGVPTVEQIRKPQRHIRSPAG